MMKKDLGTIILTKQELKIMNVVWERGTATVRNVYESMSRRKATAYTTVLTLMGILEEKGVLSHSRSGRAYVYKPLLTRQQATRNQVQDLLTRFFDGSPEKLIQNILENDVRAPEQLGTVRSLLQSKKEHQVA